jgi:mannitol/fructose-specific phosphotransferase system IIA component (Ntr-type)
MSANLRCTQHSVQALIALFQVLSNEDAVEQIRQMNNGEPAPQITIRIAQQ